MIRLGEKEYWENSYQQLHKTKQKEETKHNVHGRFHIYDWYHPYEEVAEHLKKIIPVSTTNKILHVGCGNSELGERMWQDDLGNIVNVDYSPSGIDYMMKRFESLQGSGSFTPKDTTCKYLTMDATNLEFDDQTFDYVFEKSLLDAMLCDSSGEATFLEFLRQSRRILKSTGRHICITHSPPSERIHLFTKGSLFAIEQHMELQTSQDGSDPNFLYILKPI
eukprot:TRINITY_DN13002_c0_g1_i1.p1 TRINITY_DN13002_c0_g1~~TRINITY_DN13002_c0_g1_i1.p1  ORF type:complete len:221 (+),score=38.61 TRINITY_DN13002_c0_g1_i1:31-693(+)